MTELTVTTRTFSAYDYSVEDWVKWGEEDSQTFGKVRNRSKDGCENVFHVEEYDPDSKEFADEIVELSESALRAWEGPQSDGDFSDDQDEDLDQRLDDSQIAFAATAIKPRERDIATEFNEYGIRKNTNEDGDLVSVDAVFEAMEPGPPEDRKGVRITKEFLQKVAEKDYSDNPPFVMDHTKDTLAQIGFVKDVWFNEVDEKLMVMARAYNTGSQTHDEIINRLTFEPPTIQDGSAGFGEDFESTYNEDGEVELTDGKIREFSTTPFPGGYDDGGLKTKYEDSSEADLFLVVS